MDPSGGGQNDGLHFPWPGIGRIAKAGSGYVLNMREPARPPKKVTA